MRVVAEMRRPIPMKATSYETWNVAIAFAQTGCLCDPYILPTGPSAHANPLYPILLGTLLRLTRTAPPGFELHFLLNVALASLMWAMLPLFAVVAGLTPRVGILAGALGALPPVHIWVQTHRGEPALTAIFLMMAMGYTLWMWRTEAFTLGSGLLLGALWGLAILSSASTAPVFALLILVSIYFFRAAPFRSTGFAVLAALLVMSPWLIRNWIVLGSPVLRSNFGLELRIANNEMATADSEDNLDTGAYYKYHPIRSREEALRVRQLGEVAYNRVVLHDALDWISKNPRAFVSLTLQRAKNFWLVGTNHPANFLLDLMTLLLALPGIVLMARGAGRHYALASLICLWLGYAPLYSIVQSSVRYSYPVEWSLILPIGVFAAAAVDFILRERRLTLSSPELLSDERSNHS